MKVNKQPIFAFCALFVMMIFALTIEKCTGNGQKGDVPTLGGKDINGHYDDYKEACENKAWIEAYKLCEEIKAEAESITRDIEKAQEKAQEAYGDYREAKASRFTHRSRSAKLYEEYEGLQKIVYSKEKQQAEKLQLYEDAVNYVILQEATSVLESQGLEGMPKIAFIVKEHNADWLYKDLVDIAEAMGNEDLVIRLNKLAGIPVTEDSNEEE